MKRPTRAMALPAPRADRQAAATRRAAVRVDLRGVPAVRLQARADRPQARVDRPQARADRQAVVIPIVGRARPVRIDPTAATAKIDPRAAIATIDRRAPR